MSTNDTADISSLLFSANPVHEATHQIQIQRTDKLFLHSRYHIQGEGGPKK